jgi:hypothetical protein
MKLTVNNIDHLLRAELSKSVKFVDIQDSPNGVFLVWTDGDDREFGKQTKILSDAIKNKLPIIIFDKYQKMDADDISFLVKEGVFLWEPAVSDRMFFSFQPHWGRVYTDPKDIAFDFDEVRGADLAYMSSLTKKLPSFKKYFEPMAELGEYKVVYYDYEENEHINKKVEQSGITVHVGFAPNPKMTVLLGTEQDYKTGHLDPRLFEYLEAGIVPLLPAEHRWYHSVFCGLVVDGEDQVDCHLKTVNMTAFGSVYDVYRNLSENLPEANVVNVSKRILSYLN